MPRKVSGVFQMRRFGSGAVFLVFSAPHSRAAIERVISRVPSIRPFQEGFKKTGETLLTCPRPSFTGGIAAAADDLAYPTSPLTPCSHCSIMRSPTARNSGWSDM
jgi:hypothetical protein